MVWLAGLMPYEQASEVLERLNGQMIASASIWHQVQTHGKRMKTYLKRQEDLVGVERVVLPANKTDHNQRKGVSIDGGKIHIRGEGWKEFKTGVVFDIEMHLERDSRTHELAEMPHARDMDYVAVLGSVDEFAPALWRLAFIHDIPQADESSVTADGAAWIWTLAADYFPDSVQILDWYHACDHLSEAAHALHPTDQLAAQRWFKQHQEDLFQGSIHHITRPLEQADLPQYATYFHNNKRRMHYRRFQAEGYPIGSGTVESAIKQVKQRVAGPGMRWSRSSAEDMLSLSGSIMSQSFDALWDAA
jgi:hypothetical protein